MKNAQRRRGRARAPKARPGELIMYWGKIPHHDEGVCYAWGEGVPKCDMFLLHNAFYEERPNWSNPPKACASVLQELGARGFDLTTLQFSVRKRVCRAGDKTVIDRLNELDRLRIPLSRPQDSGLRRFDKCRAELKRLRAAIEKTLRDNAHLADGDDCTLIELKRALTQKPE